MKQDRIWKHLLLSLAGALVLYVIGFTWIEHRRTRLGPWVLTFIQETNASPQILINQAKLQITDVEIELPYVETKFQTNVAIEFLPGMEVPFSVPFGECVFMDPIFLPGTVTLEISGHEIEIKPRSLIVDNAEYAWTPALRVVVEDDTE